MSVSPRGLLPSLRKRSSPSPHSALGAALPLCSQCGAPFTKASAKFCAKCGAKKTRAPTDSPTAATKPPAASLGSDTEEGGGAPPGHGRRSSASGTIPYAEPSGAASTRPPRAVLSANKKSRKASEPGETHVTSPPALPAVPAPPSTSSGPPAVPPEPAAPPSDRKASAEGRESGSDSYHTLTPTPEEEAQYSAWATLGPEGLTPEMLQTHNAVSELKTWRKGSLVGRGTYGSVYLGLLSDGSFYAVKCVELGGKQVSDRTFNVRELVSLSREINMMQRLRHKNLCSFKGVLYDAEQTSVCMFMEYVGGGSLSSIVKRFKPLPAPVVRRWTQQLLAGLLYLHSQHIIHRDVKGDNVLIDTSAAPESEAQVKLVDFGAARRLTDAVSQSRTVIGTPYWMAPEVVDVSGDGKGYSYKADVWSVGCTVAEMLTGRPPWPAKSSAPAAIMMVAAAKGMPTEVPREEATAGCYEFMLSCFERDPEKRPTVEELLHHPWIRGEQE